MLTKAFWTATAERVIASFAGAVIAILTADGFDVLSADWGGILTGGGIAALVSLLKALVASRVGDNPGPSLANETVTTTGRHVVV